MGGSEDDETADAPAWLSRAAARYGGLDELVEELGSEQPREHVSERDVDEVLETALDDGDDERADADARGPETVVADRGVDDVFAEIEVAAPDPDAGTTEERSTEDHPVLDTGPDPSFDSLAGGPDREVVEDDVNDLFDDFAEDDPAEVAAAADRDGAADDPDDATAADAVGEDTSETGEVGDEDATTDDDIESVPADLFDDLEAAMEDTPTTGDPDDATTEPGPDSGVGEEGVDVFDWVETASSPMTGGEGTGEETAADDPFESLAERTDPAPADVFDDTGDETTDAAGDADTPVGAWEYDPERGLHVTGDGTGDEWREDDTGDQRQEDGTGDQRQQNDKRNQRRDDVLADASDGPEDDPDGPENEPDGAAFLEWDEDPMATTDGADTPDDGLVGPEYAPDDIATGASGEEGESSREGPDLESTTGSTPDADGDDPAAGAPGDDLTDGTVTGSREAAGAVSPDADPADTEDTGDPVTGGPVPRESTPETATGPDALDGVADGPEDDGVIGRVRSLLGRLLP